jgi:hypothetical protein
LGTLSVEEFSDLIEKEISSILKTFWVEKLSVTKTVVP